jgi:hypothetical protein
MVPLERLRDSCLTTGWSNSQRLCG